MEPYRQIHARTITDLAKRTIIIHTLRPILSQSWVRRLLRGCQIAGIVLLNSTPSPTPTQNQTQTNQDAANSKSKTKFSVPFRTAFISFRTTFEVPGVLELDGLRIKSTRLLVRRATVWEICEVGIERFVAFCPMLIYVGGVRSYPSLDLSKKSTSMESLSIGMAGRRFDREYTIVEEPAIAPQSVLTLSTVEDRPTPATVASPASSVNGGTVSQENVSRKFRRQSSVGRIQRMIHKWKTDMILEKRRTRSPFPGLQSFDAPTEQPELKVYPDHPTVQTVKSQIVTTLERQTSTLTSSSHNPYFNLTKRHLFLHVDLIWGDFLLIYGFHVDPKKWHVGAELEVEVAFDKIIAVAGEVLDDMTELDNETSGIVTLLKLGRIREEMGKRLEKLLRVHEERVGRGRRDTESSE